MLSNRKLPVLEALFNAIVVTDVPKLQKVLFVCVQHLLCTSIDLFETLIELGANPHNIFLIGKHYSTCEAVSKRIRAMGIQLQKPTPLTRLGEYASIFNQDVLDMWQQVQYHITQHEIEAIVVLDDGGRCLEFIPPDAPKELPAIGIEQTTAGLFNPAVLNLHIPFIDVATCAAKVYLESELVVEAILQKLNNNVLPFNKKGLSCGIVGVGVIGKAVARQLISLGCNVFLYDQNKNNCYSIKEAICCDSLEDLIGLTDYIFSCTGRDITAHLALENVIKHDKIFISCTSEDKEFLTLLKLIQDSIGYSEQFHPLKDIKWKFSDNATITLIKGGFPINFDDSGESVPGNKIQLTRGLLLAALIQAITSLPNLIAAKIKGRVMLHPKAQKFVVQEWLKANTDHKFSQQLVDKFKNVDWLVDNSGGLFCESVYIKKCLANSTNEALLCEAIS